MKNRIFVGSILGAVMVGLLFPYQSLRTYAINTTITVNSLADSGAGSLRSAIVTANAAFDNVLINFSVSGTINLNSDLPYLNMTVGSVTIDGSNQIEIHKDYLTKGIGLRIGDGSAALNPTNYIIRNLTFTGFENGVINYGDLNRFENITVEGPQTLGVCDDTGEHGIANVRRDTEDVFGVTIVNNTISCYRKGIFIQNPSATTVSGNVLTNNRSNADLVTTPVFNDVNPCLVAGIEVQGSYTLGGQTVQKNYITNNEVANNGFANPGGGCSASFRSAGIILSLYGDDSISLDTPTELNRIANNEIIDNLGDGIVIFQGAQNELINNHIARNGTVPSLGDATDDVGNGIALFCNIGGIASPVTANLIYRNTIDRNADNGIFIGKLCEVTGSPEALSSAYNPLLENLIFENGRISGVAVSASDDGIGIDLEDQSDLVAFAFTSGNTNISENTFSLQDGGNQMIPTPVIATANYDGGTSSWTIEGTTFIPPGASGALVELYQVGCASADLPADLSTCDIDTFGGDTHTLGHGQGRIFLGRAYVTTSAWSINLPATVGFGGGLLTATNTAIDNDAQCVAMPTSGLQSLVGVGNRLCSSSEFSGNFLAEVVTPPSYSGVFTQVISPQTIAREGTGTVIFNFTNTGDASFSTITITDNLTTPGVTYVASTCRWSIDAMPTGVSNCSFSGNNIVLSGFSSLAPGSSLNITFDFEVPLIAALGTHTNSATVVVTPAAAITGNSADFTVTDVPAPTYSGVLNKTIVPGSIAQSGTGTTILTFTNTGTDDFTAVTLTDDLSVPGVNYITNSCRWAIDNFPTGATNCTFAGNNISLTGFTTLSPGETLYVTFEFAVPADATIGSHGNTASVAVTPTSSVPSDAANFTVTSAPATCSTTGNTVDATFTANGQSPGTSINMFPGNLVLANTQPTQGDAPIVFDWILDGLSQGTGSGVTLSMSVGTYALSHVVSDCDGSFDVETVSVIVKAVPATPVPALTLRKIISPSTNLHIGDLVTTVIQVDNPLTSTGFTMLDLSDELDGLSPLIPVCHYQVGSFPTTGSDSCSVSTNGQIVLDLSDEPLIVGSSLFIRYIAAVTGSPATYNNAVSYNTSSTVITPAPADANATFSVVATSGGSACAGVSNVDASFTLNGAATPTQVVTGGPGVMNLVNASSAGDSPVVFRWYVNGQLQDESAGTLSRSITNTTTFTLLKVDCDGSAAMDTVTVLIDSSSLPPSPGPSPSTSPSPSASPSASPSSSPSANPSPSASPTAGPTTNPTSGFTVEKEIMNPAPSYSTDASSRTIKFKSTIHNLASVPGVYNFTDTISAAFLPNAAINDTAGGIDESIPGLIRITSITIPALSSKAVIYTLTIKSEENFPLSTYRLDSNASHEDSDFYPVRVKAARLADTSNDDPDNVLDAPDGLLVNLGERGTITVDLGTNKLLIDGDGDDVAIALGQGKISVAASQDGRAFERLRGTTAFDLADADLTWARYLKITDNSISALSTATVDAVCLLNLGVSVTDSSQVALASDVRTNALTAYIDVTAAFDDPLTSKDCRTPVRSAKQARTLELAPPAPILPLPIAPTPTPSLVPATPVAVELPKTGPEGIVFTVLGVLIATYLFRTRLVRKKLVVKITDDQVKQK